MKKNIKKLLKFDSEFKEIFYSSIGTILIVANLFIPHSNVKMLNTITIQILISLVIIASFASALFISNNRNKKNKKKKKSKWPLICYGLPMSVYILILIVEIVYIFN